MPVALANARRAAEPPPDGAREGAPEGREEYEPAPPKPPPPTPPPVAGQASLTLASIRTEVAVRALAEPAPGVPVTVTQSPAARWPAVMVVNLVVAVYTTVFCAVADWTCRVPGDTAAISPEAPGMAGAPPAAPEFEPWLGPWVAGAEATVAPLLLPQAASTVTSGITASPAATWIRRRRPAPGWEGVGTFTVIAGAPVRLV